MTTVALPRLHEPTRPSPGLEGPAHRSRGYLQRFLDGDRAARTSLVDEYDAQAPAWLEWVVSQPDYLAPLIDALARGVEPLTEAALVLEVGAGSGPASGLLALQFPRLIASDISAEMLTRADPALWRVRTDVQELPFADASLDLIVGVNAVPHWSEFRRVLRPAGQLIWASSFGEETPLYTQPADVAAEFPGRDARLSTAGHGDWVVVLPETAAA